MVTEISGAGFNHSVVGQTGLAAQSRASEPVRPGVVGTTTEAGVRDKQTSSATQVAGAYAQLRARQDVLNKAADVVRNVGATVEKADQLLNGMEEALGGVVKMYPPYPVDNPERVTLLNSFGGLRRQIDALTFPPPETLDSVSKLLVPQDGTAGKAGEEEKKAAFSLIKEPMWDIPTLDSLSASDEEVSKALDQVDALKSRLADLQSGMWKDVVDFARKADTPEVRDEAASVREKLADIGDRGIGSNARQLEQAAAESK